MKSRVFSNWVTTILGVVIYNLRGCYIIILSVYDICRETNCSRIEWMDGSRTAFFKV